MEAMTVGYPPRLRGQISVTATEGEWRDVINDIIEMDPEGSSPATLKLFELLDGLGLV